MKATNYDLTQGDILRKLLLVALPIMGTQFLQMAYNLTDMFWLGNVGYDAVAAAGTAGKYMWMSVAPMMIGRMGAEIGVSQSLGRSDRGAALAFSQTALFLAVITGIVFGAVMFAFRYPLIGFFNIAEAHVVQDAANYLAIVAVGMPFTYISGAVTGIFNGAGNSRVPFALNGAGLVVNMILTPVFIFGLDMGVVGAALSTTIVQVLVAIASILVVRIAPSRPFDTLRLLIRPEWARARQIFRWTLPIVAESASFTFLAMLLGRFVAAFGVGAMAVQRVGIQIESLTWMIGIGFTSAVTAFVGQNYGAEQWDRIRRGNAIALRMMVAWGFITAVIVWVWGAQLFSIFLSEPELIREGVRFLRILSIGQVLCSLEFLSIGVFRGVGKTMPPLVVSSGANALRVVIAYVLSQTALGLSGIWWGFTIGVCLRSVALFIWYRYHMRQLPKEAEPKEVPAG